MPSPEEISNLLSRVALRDRNAFDALYDNTSPKLFGVLLRLLRDRQEAEDALQEAYVKVWQRAEQYAVSEASPISWLVAVARNHGIDRLRARKTAAHESLDDGMVVADASPNPEQSAVAASERGRIEDCLARLDGRKAEAVRGAYVEGYSYQELADRFEIPLNTIRTWLRRSLISLRECLER